MSPSPAALARAYRCRLCLLLALLLGLAGCAVSWVSSYERESVERNSAIAGALLGLYQDLLELEPAQRPAAMKGALGSRHRAIETQMRLHLLREQARPRNEQSIAIAGHLLAAWRNFAAAHRLAQGEALSDAQLEIERGILERHLRAGFVAEEAKRLGGGAASSE